MQNLQVRIKRPPSAASDFELVEAPLPSLTNGCFRAKARWLALDPFVCAPRDGGPANDLVGAGPKPGDIVPALGVWQVIESRHDIFSMNDLVVLECGLQTFCASDGLSALSLHPGQNPASTALGILGPPGRAAYFGLLDLAQLRPGETVLVSAASNAAGSMAGQIAILKGARAIGIAGAREKCEWAVRHARFSACINYRSESLSSRLKHLAPHGVDVYFDNSGGELLETIVAGHHLAPGGRIVLNSVRRTPSAELVRRGGYAPESVRMLEMNVKAYEHRRNEFLRDAITWYGADRVAYKDDVVEGLESAPAHLFRAMRGENFGRPLVKVL
jgi:NADPH-dependent curcumin reductase CurA